MVTVARVNVGSEAQGQARERELTPILVLCAVVDLFNNLNLFYSVVTEFCTVENNPTMSAGPG